MVPSLTRGDIGASLSVDLAAVAVVFDREVLATPAIDRFCSTTAWILAAATALMPTRVAFTFRGRAGYLAAMRGVHPAGFPYIEPVELAWGLAAPLIAADPVALVAEVVPAHRLARLAARDLRRPDTPTARSGVRSMR